MATDDLPSLSFAPVAVTVGGRDLAITPIRLRQVAGVTAALARIPDEAWEAALAVDLLRLGRHVDDLADAIAAAADQPIEWVMELGADDFLELAATVVEVNTDFFVRRVAPRLTVVTARIEGLVATLPAGSTPSSGSSPTATATPS